MTESSVVLPKADKNLCAETKAINVQTFSQKMSQYRHRPWSLVVRLLTILAAVLSVGVLLFIIAYILVMGVPNLTADLFSWKYTSDNVSLMPALINTVLMT